MRPTSWQFASTQGGKEDDVSNPLIEMFEGDYNYYLAREILQNALDAHDKTKNEPVEVFFSLEYFKHSMFPGYDKFLEILNHAKKFWKPEKKKTHKFLDSAIDCMTNLEISVLKISDFNTIGLNGEESDQNSPWYGLVKSVGSTTKFSGEGGSFGLGKGAPFAASYLRTLFYSTRNELGQNVFQGVAELVSHKDDDNDTKRGSGSFGLPNQSSIRNREQIDEHMVRKGKGLDIYIMGYKVEDNWQDKLSKSVLRNFWPAIHENKLVVVIDGDRLSHRNLEEKLTQHYINEPYKDNAEPEGNPLQFYLTFKNGNLHKKNLPNLKEVKFYFNRTEEPLNRVAMIRKSKMVIYTKDFRWHTSYAGVFICDNEEGNKELRAMETPEHNVWDKNRYKGKGEVIEGELRGFIRNILSSLAKIQKGGVVEIPGLHKYLPFDQEGMLSGTGGSGIDYTGNKGDEESGKEMGAYEEFDESVVISPYKVSVINEPVKGYGDGGDIVRKGKRKIKRGKKAPGGGTGKSDALLGKRIKARIFLTKQNNTDSEYQVILKSEIDKKCGLKIIAVGEEGAEKIEILNVEDDNGNRYHATGNRIPGVLLNKDQILKLKVKVKSNIKLSLKLEGHALQ